MNHKHNVASTPWAVSSMPPAAYRPPQHGSGPFPVNGVPRGFREAMKLVSVKSTDSPNIHMPDMAAITTPARKSAVKSSHSRWTSSFKPLGDEDASLDDSSSNRAGFHDLYDPALSESDHEMSPSHHSSLLSPDRNLACQRNKGRWDIPYGEPKSKPLSRSDLSPERLSPGHRLPEKRPYSPDPEAHVPSGYGSVSRPLDHRVASPDRLTHGSSTQRFPASYRAQRSGVEEREMTTVERLSPPRLQRDYEHHVKTGLDKSTASTNTGSRRTPLLMDKSSITCDLCDFEFANGQELQDHLESKTHWDTLEHIQQENNYTDMAIAFLQEVMMYKSNQCNRAIEDGVLQALQKNDHMTKIEIFHCAACNSFLSSTASSVHTHITSQEHVSNIKDFEVQQRRTCLDKAAAMMKELKPQFEHFLKGGSPFE